MFEATFFGHQGWLIRSARTCILADAILGPSFGHGPAGHWVWPPREIDFARLPPIDAVFYSHEHSDHFDIPSLAKLDRAIPILLPARASRAAQALLDEMGFTTHRLAPGDAVVIGDLELFVFSPDHVTSDNSDEWDVLPFAVRDASGDGSFACSVDVAPSPAAEKGMVAAVGGRLGIHAMTNNSVRSHLQVAGRVAAPESDTLQMVSVFAGACAAFAHLHGAPEAVLLCGAGFSFKGDIDWMNRNFFHADNARIAAALTAAQPEGIARASIPGETVRMSKGRVVAIEVRSEFVVAAPRDQWPDRTFVGDVKLQEKVEPFGAARSIADEDLPEIEALLDGFAAHLYATPIFRALHSIDRATLAGRKPTFAFVLRVEGGAYVFEWEPQACQFVAAESDDPARDYVTGAELWASDLLAVARGEVEWITVQTGHFRAWTMAPDTVTLNLAVFMMYFTALRRPDLFLRLYRNALAALPDEPPRVRPGGASITVRPREA